MTTPPPEPPPGGWPAPSEPPYPYQPYQYPPYQYQPYPGPPPRRARSSGAIIGAMAVGTVLFVVTDIAVFWLCVLFAAPDVTQSRQVAVTGAVILAVLAFGVGGGFLAVRRPWARGLGLGLMIGWALTSIVSVGICTGLNPVLYGDYS